MFFRGAVCGVNVDRTRVGLSEQSNLGIIMGMREGFEQHLNPA